MPAVGVALLAAASAFAAVMASDPARPGRRGIR
jgi:hypothetical protein